MMSPAKTIKTIVVAGWALAGLLFAAAGSTSVAAEPEPGPSIVADDDYNPDEVVGSDTCQQCHESQHAAFSSTPHAKLTDTELLKSKEHGCEACHGPGKAHVESGGDRTKIVTFDDWTSKQISNTCMKCHAGQNEEHSHFRRGEHWRNDVGCTDCHSTHGNTPVVKPVETTHLAQQAPGTHGSAQTATDSRAGAMLKQREPQLCITCHSEVKSQFTMPFRHRVLEGAMNCSDCHNPHGGFELKQERLALGSDASCVSCHTDKHGPFVFEHAPTKTEGCSSCHSPHGSANPRLLKRANVAQLCLECHSNAHNLGAPGTPSFHNLTTARIQNCTTCHSKIHGSMVSPVFFE
jgi:predicted CXXCH cytochrome family protein